METVVVKLFSKTAVVIAALIIKFRKLYQRRTLHCSVSLAGHVLAQSKLLTRSIAVLDKLQFT